MTISEMMTQLYDRFNERDVDGVLEFMAPDVSWPKASEGGRILGKSEIRSYWTRQWSEFDPFVEVLDVDDGDAGTTSVRVKQTVKNLDGDLLSETELRHVYTIVDGLITRMDIEGDDASAGAPSSAFSHPSSISQ